MTIAWTTFTIRLLVGFLLAVGIGIERQWLKTREVLKINVLVTLGSAMFVMLSIMTPGDSSPTRISAQIVSGVGFLGGGVILREGASVRGINTAATLWCAAAIGTLVGSGFLVQAYLATLVVVGANLLLRPLVETFKNQQVDRHNRLNNNFELDDSEELLPISDNFQATQLGTNIDNIYQYNCRLSCSPVDEVQILESIADFARQHNLAITSIQSELTAKETEIAETEIKLTFQSTNSHSQPDLYPQIVKLLKSVTEIDSIGWNVLAINNRQ